MNKKLIYLIGLIVIILVGVFKYQDIMMLSSKFSSSDNNPSQPVKDNIPISGIQVIKTDPDPLEWAVVLPDQEVSLTFTDPIENTGEFKHLVTPEFEYEMRLSNDKKTVFIKPKSVYPLGEEITLFIKPETKFVGGKKLDKELIYHFKTIQHRGA